MLFWSVILILVTIGLFILPLVPAIAELTRPTDIAPLRVVQAYDNNPMHFAEGFQGYINKHFADAKEVDEHSEGTLPDGTNYHKVGADGHLNMASKTTDKLFFSRYALTLPDDRTFESEIYSQASLVTGIGSHFRALFGGQSLVIGEGSTVWRWAHSDGDIVVGKNAMLNGRVTSRETMTLGVGTHFERLHAAKIMCGTELGPVAVPQIERIVLEELEGVKTKAGRRSLLEGDLNFPAGHSFDGDIVAGSTAIIGDNVYIKGNIKSNALNDLAHYLHSTGVADEHKGSARCEIGDYVQIDGAVISTHDLYIGRHCRILGPVIAENLLVIRSGTIIGTAEHPCTVTAPEIIIESGCMVYGSLWAAEQGVVHDPLTAEKEVAA